MGRLSDIRAEEARSLQALGIAFMEVIILRYKASPSPVSLFCSQVNDISLEDYIAVKAKFATFVPHTAGRYQKKRFRKAQCPIAER